MSYLNETFLGNDHGKRWIEKIAARNSQQLSGSEQRYGCVRQ